MPLRHRALQGLVCLAALAAVPSAHAADGVWAAQLATLDLSMRRPVGPMLWLDLHQRQTTDRFLAIVRPGVGVKLPAGFSLWAGYAWIPSLPDGATLSHEHRVWEQLIYGTKVGWLSFMGRLRVEQRFQQAQPQVAVRARVFARGGFAITRSVGVSVWDEAFFDLHDTAWVSRGFGQNRAFVGPYLAAPQGFRVEVGYLNQVVDQPGGLAVNHILVANVFLGLAPAGRKGNAQVPAD